MEAKNKQKMAVSQLNELGYILTEKDDKLYYIGYIYLRDTGITSLPDNLTVGGSIDLQGTGITDMGKVARNPINLPKADFFEWRNKKYIKTDGIFSETVLQKGNVYHIRQIGSTETGYLVTDGNGKWAHGDTLKEAKNDLIYKISNRDKSSYQNLTLDSELTFEEAIEAYRVVTGACSKGTRNFVENRLNRKKEKYKISEIISLTASEYGSSSFAEFLKKSKA
jgi:hypothetical protein